MPELLKIASLPDANCWIGMEGEPDVAAGFKAEKILVKLRPDGTGETVVDAKITPFTVDGRLLTPSGPVRDFLQISTALRELYREVARRLAVLEITWSEGVAAGTFFKLPSGFAASQGKFKGDARLKLNAVLDTDQAAVIAEFSARASVGATIQLPGGGSVNGQRTFAFVGVLRKAGLPGLRIDLDDFNIGLPEFKFPTLSLANDLTLDLAGPLQGIARALQRLAEVEVNFTQTSAGTPRLLITSARPFNWNVVADGAAAKFNVTVQRINGGDVFATIDELSVGGTANSLIISGKANISKTIDLKNGERRFGPLMVRWQGAKLTPVATALVNDPADLTLRGLVHVDRLMLYAADDPSTMVAVTCDVEVTPSGIRLVSLELVEPYPVKLITAAADALLRGTAAVLRFIGQFNLTSQTDVEGLKKLLKALAGIASAVARAAVFIDEVADTAAQLLRQALVGIADVIGKLFSAIEQLVEDTAKEVGNYLNIEVRIATDPFEIRQILITLRDVSHPSRARKISALGLVLDIEKGWEFGLLLDFVAQPGAYLIASRGADLLKPFATLSTDLWLQKPGSTGGTVGSVRDADSTTGDRGQKDQTGRPLVAVTAEVTNKTTEVVYVLAALVGGQAKFLQQIKDVARIRGIGGISIVTADGPFEYQPIEGDDFYVTVNFEKDRVLPLLGMGEPGKESGGGFLNRLKNSLSQTVWVKKFTGEPVSCRNAKAELLLGIKAAGVESEVTLGLELNLDTFEASIKATSAIFPLKSRRIEERALGLVWVVEQIDDKARSANEEIDMFQLSFEKGEATFKLNDKQARMEIRFPDLSSDGRGVALAVSDFGVSRAGLDLTAKATADPVVLNGINVPFQFTSGEFVVRSNRLTHASIGGRGSLPRQLVGEVDCSILLDFKQDQETSAIVLQSGKVEFDKRGEPIKCHQTRFTLTINQLDIAFVKDGGYHFFFLVTGALEFTPRDDEFTSGLLKFLRDVRIDLERTPLSADPRVLLKHISFQKALNPKKKFSLFNLFDFELRGFGFHPESAKFDGKPPAMNISGQIAFAEIGDVMQPKIDFHGLWIAPPAGSNPLPRLKADGLGVELGLSGAAKIRGVVLAVDKETTTLEGRDLAPPGFEANGFLGEGQVSIEGFATLSASMGFLEVARKDTPEERKKSFFLYLQAEEITVEIPVVIWTFYLREVGFGFGYRYTLRGIEEAANATSTAKLVKTLDEVSKRQGDLARFSSWMPDPDGDHVTLALRGAFQCFMPPSEDYDEETEKTAEEPFFFDIVAALRSDMTFLMATRGWVATNYFDFHTDTEGDKIRSHPGFRGYLFISAPRSELLSRNIGDHTGYVGKRLGNIEVLEEALKSVDWSSTLYINPRLFHFELGWPNELVVRLRDDPNFRVTVRGGMIFRVAEDGILWGYNIEADAFIIFSGGFGGGSIGVAVEASLVAKFVARLIAFISWRVKGTLVYGLISLDANLAFSVRAWMEVDLGITSFTIRISSSFQIQFSAAVELALSTEGVGGRVSARVAIAVFGCHLSAHINFTVGAGQLDSARARVERFMALGIANEATPDPAKVVSAQKGDQQIVNAADQAETKQSAPIPPTSPPQAAPSLKTSIRRSALGRGITATGFWLVLHMGNDDTCYGLLVPREPDDSSAGFYSAPCVVDPGSRGVRSETKTTHALNLAADFSAIKRWKPGVNGWEALTNSTVEVTANWNKPIPGQASDGTPTDKFRLAHLFDECFLYDADWNDPNAPYRETTKWTEPPARRHEPAKPPSGIDETARNAERDRYQRERNAHMDSSPLVAAVYEARSTVLSIFTDQFVALAKNGGTVSADEAGVAHVTDIGLVFQGKAVDFERFADKVTVGKADYGGEAGKVKVFNPASSWFAKSDPILDKTKDATVDTAGVKLDWQLRMAWIKTEGDDASSNPEQFLHHYEIICELDGTSRWDKPMLIKPAATFGLTDKDTGSTRLLRPDWQFVDNLADLADDQRKAMLPTTGEEDALHGAVAWIKIFGDRQTATLTYSITPVDIAGTRGTERSFVVDVHRPQPPIRASEAELRIFVRRGSEAHPYPSWHNCTDPPKNLGVVLALRDKAAADDENVPIGNVQVSRQYRLIVDPEDVVPTGNFGSDCLTDRLRSPQTTAAQQHADEVTFTFDRKRFDQCSYKGPQILAVEPDPDAQKLFNYWLRFAGQPTEQVPEASILPDPKLFFDTLWRRAEADGGRVACRFSLQTLMTVSQLDEHNNIVGEPPTFESRRVPVSIEVIMDNVANGEKYGPVLMRPEAFEWPVRLDLPPLGPGQVRARAGFALFRAPADKATLNDMIADANGRLLNVRDPERRILTTVEWDAVPDWAVGANTGPDTPKAMHAATIGGFDLHELDIDELAPLDTASGKVGRPLPFAQDVTLWRRARRVARIQQLPASAAMLVPHTNDDLLGWLAHYPSETWRLDRGDGGTGSSDHNPIYRSWWTAAEATPYFPNKILRRRLMPLTDENVVSALLAGGRPQRIFVRLETAEGSGARAALDGLPIPALDLLKSFAVRDAVDFGKLFATIEDGKKGDDSKKDRDWTGWKKIRLNSNGKFSPSDLRALLLCLIWKPDSRVDLKYAGQPGVVLTVAGEIDIATRNYASNQDVVKHIPTGQVDVPLVFSAPTHPVIEETIAELALSVRDADQLYRRYTPVLQPVLKPDVKDLPGFLSATAAAKDPYGWGVLQSLGLAVTLRLFDGNSDAFVEPDELLARVNSVMNGVVKRYCTLVTPDTLGAPFAEILLRPGKDRVPGPFDAMLDHAPEKNFKFGTNALALVQISLRPVALQAFNYALLEMGWIKRLTPKPQESDTFELGVQFVFAPSSEAPIDILRVADNRLIELKQKGETSYLAPIRQPTRATTPFDGELTLLVRWPRGVELKFEQLIELQLVTRTRKVIEGKIVDSDAVVPGDQKAKFLTPFTSFNVVQPGSDGPNSTPKGWIAVDSFERLKPQDAKTWAVAFLDKPDMLPSKAFGAFCRHVTAAFPKLVWPRKRDEFDNALATYADWAQRFLDHGTGPDGPPLHSNGDPPRMLDVSVALAAPSKATPWRLAASADGTQSLSFLHSDRWGHARGYALKPFGRYQEMAIGAGAYPNGSSGRELAEALIDPEALLPDQDVWKLLGFKPEEIPKGIAPPSALNRPLGYGVAVSPRTERVEPPLILGSGTTEKDKEWQLVVPLHGEETFAFSNRSLFARLGWEGVALSFVRDYSEPYWPSRLKAAMDDDGKKVDAELHPVKPPPEKWQRPDSAAPAINRAALGKIAEQFPSLWKGADIYRIPKLPHYYRSTVLATARAGIVVSPITTVIQEVFHTERPDLKAAADSDGKVFGSSLVYQSYRPPPTQDTPNPTPLFGTLLRVTLPLVAHYDLMDKDTREIWADGLPQSDPTRNVAWWPDPNVIYTLFHGASRNDGSIVEDEYAEIRLVARPESTPSDPPPATNIPIVVRARGTRFDSVSEADANPSVSQRKINNKRRRFSLNVYLALKPGRSPLASARVPTPTDPNDIKAFNELARRWLPLPIPEHPGEQYAQIVSRHSLTVVLNPTSAETGAEFFARLKILAKSLNDSAELIGRGVAGNAEVLRSEGQRLQKCIDSHPLTTSPGQILDEAKLPRKITIWWPHGIEFKPMAEGMQDCEIALIGDADADFPASLMVLATPSDADFKKLSDSPDLNSDGAKKALGLLAALTKDVLTGGRGTLLLRAVHGRGGTSDNFEIAWPTWLPGDRMP